MHSKVSCLVKACFPASKFPRWKEWLPHPCLCPLLRRCSGTGITVTDPRGTMRVGRAGAWYTESVGYNDHSSRPQHSAWAHGGTARTGCGLEEGQGGTGAFKGAGPCVRTHRLTSGDLPDIYVRLSLLEMTHPPAAPPPVGTLLASGAGLTPGLSW